MDRVLSIVIPVYQAADTLKRCVLSCCSLKGIEDAETEIILIDDGSTDGSAEICDELVASNSEGRIKVKHTSNCGVSHARNLGIEMATGKYICFVDADDTIKEDFATALLTKADEGIVLVDDNENYVDGGAVSGYQYVENSTLNRNTHVWGKLFARQAIIDNHIMFREGLTIGEDLLFLIDMALSQGRNKTIKCVGGSHYNYTDNPNGAMKRAFKESYLDEIVCWREAEKKLMAAKGYISEYAFVSVAVSQIMTALLVAGKLAMVEEKDRDDALTELTVMRVGDQIKHALKTRGAFAALSFGYKIKVNVFRLNPYLYLRIYGNYKK